MLPPPDTSVFHNLCDLKTILLSLVSLLEFCPSDGDVFLEYEVLDFKFLLSHTSDYISKVPDPNGTSQA